MNKPNDNTQLMSTNDVVWGGTDNVWIYTIQQKEMEQSNYKYDRVKVHVKPSGNSTVIRTGSLNTPWWLSAFTPAHCAQWCGRGTKTCINSYCSTRYIVLNCLYCGINFDFVTALVFSAVMLCCNYMCTRSLHACVHEWLS